MKQTYKAMQVSRPGQLECVEKELPVPGPGEVLIKVEACGICGADSGVVEGLEKSVEYQNSLVEVKVEDRSRP